MKSDIAGFSRDEWIAVHELRGATSEEAREATEEMFRIVSEHSGPGIPLGFAPEFLVALASLSADTRHRVHVLLARLGAEARARLEQHAPGLKDL